MCGIKGIFYCCKKCNKRYIQTDLKYFIKMLNRGPDNTSIINDDKFFLGIHRLSLINTTTNQQPYNKDEKYFVCNGEIYNYKDLSPDSTEDCEVLYENIKKENYISFLKYNMAGNEFAFIYYDNTLKTFLVGRDEYGVRPLYMGVRECFYKKEKKTFIFSSELKSINPQSLIYIKQFTPGTCFDGKKYYSFANNFKRSKYIINYQHNRIKELLISSVSKRVLHIDETSKKAFGVLLSGGVDSSLVTAIAFDILKEKYGEEYAQNNLYVFTILYKDENFTEESEDVKCAKLLTSHLGLKHHYVFSFSYNDVKNNLEELIYTIESYDITTARASLPQFIIGKRIKEYFPFIKFILTGEGADEIFGGYKYLKGILKSDFSRDEQILAFEKESKKLISEIHLFDGLRTDRTMSASSLEVRVPFLDSTFVNYVFNVIEPYTKMPSPLTEKDILRESFNDYKYIPASILFRSKEAFSDSITNNDKDNWFRRMFKNIEEEKKTYLDIFNSFYTPIMKDVIPHYWMPSPLFTSGAEVTDPSAKVLKF